MKEATMNEIKEIIEQNENIIVTVELVNEEVYEYGEE